ncbi:MAG: EAL domain-containing protein [Candidatus Sedimenticola sp. 1PA]
MDSRFEREVFAEQLKILYAGYPQSFFITIAVATVMTVVHGETAEPILCGWLLLHAVVLIGRGILTLRYQRAEPNLDELGTWSRYYLIGITLSGLVWGSAGLLLFPESSLPLQVFTVLVLAGLSAGALSVLGVMIQAYLLYALPVLVPVVINSLLHADQLHYSISILVLLLFVFLFKAARRLSESLSDSFRLRFENQDLLNALQAEKNQLGSRLTRILQDFSTEIYIVDLDTLKIIQANAGAVRNLGYSEDELMKLRLTDVCPTLMPGLVTTVIDPLRSGERDYAVFRGNHSRKDGSTYPVEARYQISQQEEPPVCVVTVLDVTERFRYEERLRYHTDYDQLTGLPNKTLALTRASQAYSECRRTHAKMVLMFLDLDDFKNINDTMGHNVGDEVLMKQAQRLKRVLRATDTAARISGDEFLILITELRDEHHTVLIAEKILDAVEEPFSVADKEIFMTASIGISIYPDDASSPEMMLKHADAAMYGAKGLGKNNFQFFTQSMEESAERLVAIEFELRKALENGELDVHYQLQCNGQTSNPVGVEALLRWHSSALGNIPPAEFIPVAESTGMIMSIGEWVLHKACLDAARWYQLFVQPLKVAVNVSSRQFKSGTLVQSVNEALTRSGLPPEMLELEVTESLLVEDVAETMETLNSLRALGVSLSLDDFGTGYSSLSYLKRFPLQVLKIDKSFIQDIEDDINDQTLVNTIIVMSHSLNLSVVAEGVETAEELEFLLEHGVDVIQGYLVSKPLPVSELEDQLLCIETASPGGRCDGMHIGLDS